LCSFDARQAQLAAASCCCDLLAMKNDCDAAKTVQESGLAAEFDGFVAKPFDLKSLEKLCERSLQVSRSPDRCSSKTNPFCWIIVR